MFRKVLIANRGEIAVRVIRGARELGLATVAVYSAADRTGLPVRVADEAVGIGPAPPLESYLSIPAILEAARRTGADAIHPGYGFLSENALFAKACEDEGIAFIGPCSRAMEALGDKVSARLAADKARVPTVPGDSSPVTDLADLERRSDAIGYPVILKASGGGGGKGLRVVPDKKGLGRAFEIATSEVKKSFARSAFFVEKYLRAPHHVEIQVAGDRHGGAAHLFERECSVQRRYQKLVEEAPSPFLTPDVRQKMGDAAVRLVRSVGYDSVGTCEFLVDSERRFYFLEMNTRLQVEHPVTEMTTGVDLVALQIRIAAGERIPFRQEDVAQSGHAIEARICAEDPDSGFLPSVGTVTECDVPGGPGIRVDSGLFRGAEVSLFYDPILAKVIAHGATRDEARRRLANALAETRIAGVSTTAPFLCDLLRFEDFAAGRYDTSIVPRFLEARKAADGPLRAAAAIAAAAIRHRDAARRAAAGSIGEPGTESPWVVDGRRRALGRGG